ncbi:hypothetical protein GTY54_49385 [Streptomyces sp. SID625]|nr:hypothetical protein [Streptomyces sp. SID625]
MYLVTIEHPGIKDRTYSADRPGELRNIVWACARVQGKPIPDADDREMIHEVGALRSQADINGEGALKVHDITVKVAEADPAEYACEGHEGEDAVLLGGPKFCDGRCKPRTRFTQDAAVALACALDDADLEAEGGCGPCGLEVDQMCAACGKCNCHTHETCARPTGERA